MKQLKYISIISIMALITAPAVADIASSEYVDSVVGTMTQSAINTALAGKQDKLPTAPNDGKKYSLIWNGNGFAFEEFTTGGGSTPIDWDAIEAAIDSSAHLNNTYAGYGLNGEYCEGYHYIYDSDGNEDGYWFGSPEEDGCNPEEFDGMVAGDWYVDIPSPINVKIEGRALCSSTEGADYQPGNPDGSGSGYTQYCWCKITSPSASRWVFYGGFGNADDCANYCASGCASDVQLDSALRSALFGSIGD